jgi:myosin-crossreactive antigen
VRKGDAKTSFGTVDAVEGDTVRKIGELPTARGAVGGFHSPEDGACAGGGRQGGELRAEVECITPDGATKKLPSLETPRHSLMMAAVDGRAYALLGSDDRARTFRIGEVLPLGGAEG